MSSLFPCPASDREPQPAGRLFAARSSGTARKTLLADAECSPEEFRRNRSDRSRKCRPLDLAGKLPQLPPFAVTTIEGAGLCRRRLAALIRSHRVGILPLARPRSADPPPDTSGAIAHSTDGCRERDRGAYPNNSRPQDNLAGPAHRCATGLPHISALPETTCERLVGELLRTSHTSVGTVSRSASGQAA